jgi:NAD(P)-dependent dehydrogenase (short-subunit alcohol dehydrogenase family)
MAFNIDQIPSQKGRIAVVTGSNTGLGYETALALAQKEAKVILACRNMTKAENAKNRILQAAPGADVDMLQIDLSKLDSVKGFARNFQDRYHQLDLLINNAGVMMPPYTETDDGFELQIGANHLGHFLLTGLLMDKLVETPNSRIVSLSSLAHKNGAINFDDLHSKKEYSASKAYGQSKLACLVFAYELQRRLENAGHHDTLSVAAHPGIAFTDLGRHFPKLLYTVLTRVLGPFVSHPPKEGAKPTLLAALGERVSGGEYFGPTGFREMKGKPGKATSTELAKDEEVARRLWEVSEALTGIQYL